MLTILCAIFVLSSLMEFYAFVTTRRLCLLPRIFLSCMALLGVASLLLFFIAIKVRGLIDIPYCPLVFQLASMLMFTGVDVE